MRQLKNMSITGLTSLWHKRASVIAVLCIASATGCTAELVDEPEAIGEASLGFGEAACANLGVFGTYTAGYIPWSFSTVTTYDDANCDKALAFQINDYSESYDGDTSQKGLHIWWNGGALNQSECPNASVNAQLYHWTGSAWDDTILKQTAGTWHDGACVGLEVYWANASENPDAFIPGDDYKVVAQALYSGATRSFGGITYAD